MTPTNDRGFFSDSQLEGNPVKNIYSKKEIDDKLASISVGAIDLSNYYTKKETDGLIKPFLFTNNIKTL
jgi:hypothetical protein